MLLLLMLLCQRVNFISSNWLFGFTFFINTGSLISMEDAMTVKVDQRVSACSICESISRHIINMEPLTTTAQSPTAPLGCLVLGPSVCMLWAPASDWKCFASICMMRPFKEAFALLQGVKLEAHNQIHKLTSVLKLSLFM